MVKMFHRNADAKTLHNFPLLSAAGGDNNRVVFLSERDFAILLNCLELTERLKNRVFYSAVGDMYEIVSEEDFVIFQGWVQELYFNLGEWQLSNQYLERIAIALENMEANQESVLSIEDAIAWAENTYGVTSVVAAGVRAFLEAIPSLGFKIPITALWQLGTDIAAFKTTMATLAGITLSLNGISAAIAAHLPLAAATLLMDRIVNIKDLLFQVEEAFQNWWNGESVSWWDILDSIWEWITGSGEEPEPVNPSDQIQIRQAQAMESISDHLGGIKQCICNQNSGSASGGANDMTTVNVYNGCCSTCGGQTGSNPTNPNDNVPPEQPYPTLPPWQNVPPPAVDVFPSSFGTMENWLAYRCQVAHAIFEVMKETTSLMSIQSMVAWIAASWTMGWSNAAGSIQSAITSSIIGSLLLPSGGIAALAIGLLNVIRTHQNFIYNLAFFDSLGLRAWMDENKETIICEILATVDHTLVFEVFQNDVMEAYGAQETTEEFYTEVFKWLLPPALSSALFQDGRAQIDLSGISYNQTICACDPASSGIGGSGSYVFCNPFSGDADGQFSGPVPSGVGTSGWTSNDGATVSQGEGLALMNYPSATITGVNGLHVNFPSTALVEDDLIGWFCVAISLGFNDFACEVYELSTETWHQVDENLGVIQGSGSYINFVIPAGLDGLEVTKARLLIKGQNFCNISHMYIGDEPCA